MEAGAPGARWTGDALLVAAAALLVHGRTVAFGFTGLDDQDLIVDDQAFLSAPSSLWRVFGRAYMHVVDASHAYWRPLVTWTFTLDAQWSGARPVGYHLTNVVLHAVACVLVWALLSEFHLGRGATLAAALVFAVHPALAPAVAWIPGRNDALLAVFAVAAWLALARGRTALHLGLFGLALLAKETALVLPLVWVAHAALVPAGAGGGRRLAPVAVGWGVLVAARLLLHPALVRPTLSNLPLLLGALGKLALPLHLSVLAVAEDVPLWPGVVAMVALGLATRLVPGVRVRVVALGLAAFALLLLPSLLLPGTLVVDSRLYLPAVGVVLVLGELARALAPERRTLLAFAGVTVAALGALAVAFEAGFRDERAFAREAVDGSPHSALAHLCLGRRAQLEGRDDVAVAEYEQALALGPAEVVHNDLAVLHMKHARWQDAERELRQELADNPRYARAYFNLGIVLRREGRGDEACAAEEDALRLGADDDATRRERDRDCATGSPPGGSR